MPGGEGRKKKRKKHTLKKGTFTQIAKDSKFHPPLLSFTGQVWENYTNNKWKHVGMYKNARTQIKKRTEQLSVLKG